MNLPKMINRFKFNVAVIIFGGISVWAQADGNSSQTNYNVGMFPKTPDAAAAAKFVDIPAGNYTGIADFTIPLYTIEFDGGNTPIQLNYSTTGVKVAELASRVGLGWSLNTGASLTQQVMGAQDVVLRKPIVTNSFNPVPPGNPNDFNDPYYVAMKATGLIHGEDVVDIEPDIYSYSLLNGGGKFIIDSGGEFGIPMPYNQTKITPTGSGMTIQDESGNTYVFDKHSSGAIKSSNTCARNVTMTYDDPNYKILNIKSAKNRQISYTYGKTIDTKFVTSITEQKRQDRINDAPGINPPPLAPQCINYSQSKERILTQISFEGGKVFFYYNTDAEGAAPAREDLVGDVYLTRVIVKSDQNVTIKDFTLQYDYFRSTDSPPTYPSQYSQYMQGINRRLKLIKVIDNLTLGEHNLAYYESHNGKTLPVRISNSQDYWGIFNGVNNGNEAIPTIKYNSLSNPGTYKIIFGANKEPNIDYGIIGNLEKIEYPTGGYTKVTYEADDYIKNFYVPPIYSYENSDPVYTDSNSSTGITFPIPINTYEKKIVFYGESTGNNQIGVCRWDLYDAQNNFIIGGTSTGTFPRNDAPGTYKLKVTPGDNPNIACSAEYSWINEIVVDNSDTRKAGTIRVQKIESFDNNNGKIIRTFTYKEPTPNYILPYTKSSGKNLGNEIFIGLSTQWSPSGIAGNMAQERILSNNPGWQTNTVRGKPIGYDYVQEYYVSEKDPSKSYRKEYKFQNDVDDMYAQHNPYSPINFSWPVDGLDRGLLLEEIIFDGSNKMLKKTTTEYDRLNTHFNTYATSHLPGSSVVGLGLEVIPVSSMGTNYGFEWEPFPIKNFWITDTITTTKEYITPTYFLETVKRTKYSTLNYKHTYPVEIKTTGSLGENMRTEYYYPQDLNAYYEQDAMMQKLVLRNQVSSPVITKTFENSKPISEQRTHYAHFYPNDPSGGFILPQFIYVKKGEIGATSSVEDRKITYDRYDIFGNLEQYTMENGTVVSIIWGYGKKYPIAKVEGVPYASISTTLINNAVNASDLDSNEATEATLLPHLENLRKDTNLANAVITTYTYDPLKGVTTVIAPNGQESFYIYDNAGRLDKILDKNKKVLKKMEYNYQH